MKIKIGMKTLSEQIHLCDACAEKFGDDTICGGLFAGIANFLSEISIALEEDEEIEIVRGEEEE